MTSECPLCKIIEEDICSQLPLNKDECKKIMRDWSDGKISDSELAQKTGITSADLSKKVREKLKG